MDSVEVTEQIVAPADRVWALIEDPTTMGELTAECHAMTWTGGATAPAVGAQFRGSNRRGWRRWTTTCTIVDYRPGTSIAWDVHAGPLAVARWSYRIEPPQGASQPGPDDQVPTGDQTTTLVERFEDRRASALRAIGPLLRGVPDTNQHNRSNMAETLRRIKRHAEG